VKAVKYVAIALVTIGLLFLAFRGQDLSTAFASIEHANMLALLGGLLIMFLSHGVRAARWQIILRPLKRKTSLWLAFKATIAGYGMNNLIPRSGELARPYLMARGEKIPMAGTLASVVVERLADVVALAGLVVFSLLTFRERVTSVFPMLSNSALVALAALMIMIGGVIFVFFSERRTEQFMAIFTKPLPAKWSGKIDSMARDFSRGLRGLERSAIVPLVLGTIGIWVLYGISMYVSLQGFSDSAMRQLGISDAFFLLTLSGIAFTIPTPGATGSYHALITTGLAMVFGVAPATALAYAIVTHALSYISVTVLGLVFLASEGLSFGSASDLRTSSAVPTASLTLATSEDG
jgi:hypothetical protein